MTLPAPAIPASGVGIVNPTGQNVALFWTGGTVQALAQAVAGLTSTPGAAAPAVPATGVNATNPFGTPCLVNIGANGATITAVTVSAGGGGSGTAAGLYLVPAGGTISIAYTVATPTWTWTPVSAALVGNGANLVAGTPFNVPPGATVIPVYSVVPTSWTWANPLEVNSPPGYAAENTQTGAGSGEIPALPSTLPLTSRSMGGQVGLGVAESN